jgi:hypothetical protein
MLNLNQKELDIIDSCFLNISGVTQNYKLTSYLSENKIVLEKLRLNYRRADFNLDIKSSEVLIEVIKQAYFVIKIDDGDIPTITGFNENDFEELLRGLFQYSKIIS